MHHEMLSSAICTQRRRAIHLFTLPSLAINPHQVAFSSPFQAVSEAANWGLGDRNGLRSLCFACMCSLHKWSTNEIRRFHINIQISNTSYHVRRPDSTGLGWEAIIPEGEHKHSVFLTLPAKFTSLRPHCLQLSHTAGFVRAELKGSENNSYGHFSIQSGKIKVCVSRKNVWTYFVAKVKTTPISFI